MSTMTLAQLKLRAQISFPNTLDGYYQSLLDAAEEMCLQECGLDNGQDVQYFNGGASAYVLRMGPVNAVSSVIVNGTALEQGAYRFDARSAKLTIPGGTPKGVDNVVVTYSCAFTESELFMNCIAMTVQHLAKLQSAKQVGVLSRSTEGGTEQLDQKILPEAVKGALNKFKRGYVVA